MGMSKERLTNYAKAIIAVVSITHLVFASIHVKAMLLLENETCGFVMFLFVLAGLVALFEAMRIRREQAAERVITILVCLGACVLGFCLVSIYQNAIALQHSLDTAVVKKAVVFSMAIIAFYAASGIFVGFSLIKKQ